MQSMIAPFIDAFKQRLTSPFLSSLAVASLVVTWQGLLKILLGERDISVRISAFRNEYWFGKSEFLFLGKYSDLAWWPSWLLTLVYIAALFAFFAFIVSYINLFVEHLQIDAFERRKANKIRMIRAEQAAAIAIAERELAASTVGIRNDLTVELLKLIENSDFNIGEELSALDKAYQEAQKEAERLKGQIVATREASRDLVKNSTSLVADAFKKFGGFTLTGKEAGDLIQTAGSGGEFIQISAGLSSSRHEQAAQLFKEMKSSLRKHRDSSPALTSENHLDLSALEKAYSEASELRRALMIEISERKASVDTLNGLVCDKIRKIAGQLSEGT